MNSFFSKSLIWSCFFLLLIGYPSNLKATGGNTSRNIKLLILILASDDYPVYCELQKIWRAYMHSDPENIEAYFIKADPNLPSDCLIDGDIVWLKCEECIKPGIINKTIMSFEHFLPRIGTEFTYVLRTNLSSFYILPRLLTKLKTYPRRSFYCSADSGTSYTGSGAGYILSPDLVELLVNNKHHFLDNTSWYDDGLVGEFLNEKGIRVQRHDRIEFHSLQEWYAKKNTIGNLIFQCRIKGPTWDIRLQEDIYIHKELLKQYYGIIN